MRCIFVCDLWTQIWCHSFHHIRWNDYKLKSSIDIFRNEAPQDHSTSILSTHRLLQWGSVPTFIYLFMSSIWVRLHLHTHTHTAALVTHLHLPTLTTASCVLPWTFISAHLALPVWQEIVCQLTRQGRTPAALNAPLSVEMCLFWQQPVICPPPFCVWSYGPCGGCLLLLAKPHGFPAFHHSPSHVGRSANSTLLHGRDLKFQNSLGLEARPEFPPCPSATQDPTPFLSQSLQAIWDVPHLLHRAVCTLLTWSQSSQAPRGTWPLLHCPQKPQGAWLPRNKAWPCDVILKRVRMYNPGERVVVCHEAV